MRRWPSEGEKQRRRLRHLPPRVPLGTLHYGPSALRSRPALLHPLGIIQPEFWDHTLAAAPNRRSAPPLPPTSWCRFKAAEPAASRTSSASSCRRAPRRSRQPPGRGPRSPPAARASADRRRPLVPPEPGCPWRAAQEPETQDAIRKDQAKEISIMRKMEDMEKLEELQGGSTRPALDSRPPAWCKKAEYWLGSPPPPARGACSPALRRRGAGGCAAAVARVARSLPRLMSGWTCELTATPALTTRTRDPEPSHYRTLIAALL